MKPKIVIHSYNKSRWKHSSYKEKANKKMNKIYPDLKYHGKLLELQFQYLLYKHIYFLFFILFYLLFCELYQLILMLYLLYNFFFYFNQ